MTDLMELAKQFKKQIDAQNKAVQKLIFESDLTDEELLEFIDVYPDWNSNGVEMKIGDYVKYNDKLYKTILAHTTSTEFTPDVTNYAFVEVVPGNVIPDFSKPSGYEGAYDKGDKVVFEDKVYESLIDGNTWSPSEASQHWEIVES